MESGQRSQVLIEAVQAQDPLRVKEVLSKRANPGCVDSRKVSALHLAALAGDAEIIELLLEAKADVNVLDPQGQPPCFFAPSGDVCYQLCAAQADVNLLSSTGQSALHVAAYSGLTDTVEWLLSHMKPNLVNLKDNFDQSALDLAMRHSQRSGAAKLLLEHSATPDVPKVLGLWAELLPKEWRCQGGELAMEERGITCAQLLELFHFQKEVFGGPLSKDQVAIRGEAASFKQVLEHIVMPLTEHFHCSWAELVASASPEPRPLFLISVTPTLPFQDLVAAVQLHCSKRQSLEGLSYWIAALAAEPGMCPGRLSDFSQGLLSSSSCVGCLCVLNAAAPSECAFRDKWCMMELAFSVEETQKRPAFSLDMCSHVPAGAVKFGNPLKGLESRGACTVLQLQHCGGFCWESPDSCGAWPTWQLREGATLASDEVAKTLSPRQLEELRRHFRRRFASALIYGLSGGRPLCDEDAELLQSLLGDFPEAASEPAALGETPVLRACAWGSSEALALLLEVKAQATTARLDQVTPVQAARAHGHHEVLKLLGEELQVPEPPVVAALNVLVLQDDISWGAAIPIQPVLREKLMRSQRSGSEAPALNGITLQQLEELGDVVKHVVNHTVNHSKDSAFQTKRVVWDVLDRETLQTVGAGSAYLRSKERLLLASTQASRRTQREAFSAWRKEKQRLEQELLSVNMYHIVDLIIKPLAHRHRCSWVRLAAEKEQRPVFFVSHWWGGSFKETLEKLRFHHQERCFEVQAPYWICTLANNQLDFDLDAGLEDVPFSLVLKHEACLGIVALVDKQVELFHRVWCIFELHLREEIQIRRPDFVYDLAMWVPQSFILDDHGEVELLPEGAILSSERSGQRAQHERLLAPVEVALQGIRIDVAQAQSTMPEDKRRILRYIAKVKEGEPDPSLDHAAFHELNTKLRRRFAAQLEKEDVRLEATLSLMRRLDFTRTVLLRALLEQFPDDRDKRDHHGRTPVFRAALWGSCAALRVFLEARADPNLCNNEGRTPTFVAADQGNLDILKELLEARGDLSSAELSGTTPLLIASRRGHLDLVKELLKAQAHPDQADKEERTPVFMASALGHLEVLQELLEARANPQLKKRTTGASALFQASQDGHLEVLMELLQARADPNEPLRDGTSPVFVASQNRHLGVLQVLLKARADPNLAREDGATPAFQASKTGHLDILKQLLEAGASPQKRRQDGCTPCIIALDRGHTEIFRLLLQAHADPDAATHTGRTAGMTAAECCNHEALAILRQATALKRAKRQGLKKVLVGAIRAVSAAVAADFHRPRSVLRSDQELDLESSFLLELGEPPMQGLVLW